MKVRNLLPSVALLSLVVSGVLGFQNCVPTSGTDIAAIQPTDKLTISNGQTKSVGDSSHQMSLSLRGGDLQLILANNIVWHTDTAGKCNACLAIYQTDGNVVLYSQDNGTVPIWNSATFDPNSVIYFSTVQPYFRLVGANGNLLYSTGAQYFVNSTPPTSADGTYQFELHSRLNSIGSGSLDLTLLDGQNVQLNVGSSDMNSLVSQISSKAGLLQGALGKDTSVYMFCAHGIKTTDEATGAIDFCRLSSVIINYSAAAVVSTTPPAPPTPSADYVIFGQPPSGYPYLITINGKLNQLQAGKKGTGTMHFAWNGEFADGIYTVNSQDYQLIQQQVPQSAYGKPASIGLWCANPRIVFQTLYSSIVNVEYCKIGTVDLQ